MNSRRALWLLSLTVCVACDGEVVSEDVESVMDTRMRIVAETELGRIEVVAKDGTLREYKWDGCDKEVRLWPRTERWMGSMGLYYPGPGRTWLFGCEGVSRAVLNEGQMHFGDEEEALLWLGTVGSTPPSVYSSDGLVVAWGISPGRGQINVDVWRIYIDGRRPTALPGAADEKIMVTPAPPIQ